MQVRGKIIPLMLLLLALGGCAAGPDYERPELDVPETYVQPVQQGESFANTPWWELFQDEQLQALIRIARPLYADEDLGLELNNTVYALDASTIDL